MKKNQSIPYSERSDINKIESNWNKTNGLLERQEWSGAILRAATAVEIAANLVVREELINQRNLEADFVNHLLLWANGLQGKFTNLILPITKSTDKHDRFKPLQSKISSINKERNSIAHSGQFKMDKTAKRIIEESRDVILSLVTEYNPQFSLDKIKVAHPGA